MAYAKFEPEKSEIFDVAMKYNGNIQAVARHFNIASSTMYEYFDRDPEGRKVVDKVRKMNTELELDSAEHVVRYHMSNYKTNGALSLRAAEKVIDKKGYSRGWRDRIEEVENVSEDLKSKYDSLMKQLTEIRELNSKEKEFD